MADFRWQKAFSKDGVLALTQADVANLARLQSVYSDTYVPFLNSLADTFGDETEIGQKVVDIRSAVFSAVRSIGAIMRGRLSPAGAKEAVRVLASTLKYVNKGLAWLKKNSSSERSLSEMLAEVEKAQGMTLKDISKGQKIYLKKVKKFKPQGKLGIFDMAKEVTSPEILSLLSGTASSVGDALLGPYANLARAAFHGTIGAARGVGTILNVRKKHKEAALLSRLSGGSAMDQMKEYSGLIEGGTRVPDFILNPRMEETAPRMSRRERAAYQQRVENESAWKRMGLPFKSRTGGADQADAQSMFFFYDKLAPRAKWTRQILKVLEEGPDAKKGSGFGILGTLKKGLGAGLPRLIKGALKPVASAGAAILGTLKKGLVAGLPLLIKGALKTVAVVGWAMLGWQVGTWLREKFPQIDKFLTDMFTKMWLKWFEFVDKIKETWSKVTGKVSEGLQKAKETVGEVKEKTGTFFKNFFDKFKRGRQSPRDRKGETWYTVPTVDPKDIAVADMPERGRYNQPSVPVTTSNASALNRVAATNREMAVALRDMVQTMKKEKKVATGKDQVKDTYSLRDPLLDALVSGNLALEG